MAQRPSILQFEQTFLRAWPAAITEHDGSWIRQFADGYTKRANSVQSMDPHDDLDADARLQRYIEWANAKGEIPTFRVTPLAGTGIIAALNKLHWQPFEQSVVMALPVGAAFTPKHSFKVFDANNPDWYQVQAKMSGYGTDTIDGLKNMLDRIASDARGILVFDDAGDPAAAALACVHSGIGVYLNVVVREGLRGQGFGRCVMQAALNWSREKGINWAAIQVLADNVPAINLYRSLGFEEIYRYQYRRPA